MQIMIAIITGSTIMKSGKIALKEIFNKGTISFYDTLSIDTINAIMKQYESIQYTFNLIKTSFITVNVDSKSCSETDLLFSKIKKDSRISNCDKFLVTADSLDSGYFEYAEPDFIMDIELSMI